MSQKLLKYFLKLGTTGFGGPLALIQQMRRDLVESQKLIEADEFDQAFTLIKAMPGPIAFQVAVHCGYKLNGFWGALTAGFGLIFPAFLMMILMGQFYSQIVDLGAIKNFFVGMQYAVAAVILIGIKGFSFSYRKNYFFWFIVAVAGLLFFFKLVPEGILIVGSGLILVFAGIFKNHYRTKMISLAAPMFFIGYDEKLLILFKTCFTAGALVFGTGLAVFPFLQAQLVEQYMLLPISIFNDGVTFGQMTPGPVTISTTFMGFQISGIQGAFVATIGLLLPPFFHMTTWFPKAMKWMARQTWIPEFILGSTAAVVGCLLVTVYRMNMAELHHSIFWIIFLSSLLILFLRPKFSILKVLLGAGLFHLVLRFLS
jgi:chromate transporter